MMCLKKDYFDSMNYTYLFMFSLIYIILYSTEIKLSPMMSKIIMPHTLKYKSKSNKLY